MIDFVLFEQGQSSQIEVKGIIIIEDGTLSYSCQEKRTKFLVTLSFMVNGSIYVLCKYLQKIQMNTYLMYSYVFWFAFWCKYYTYVFTSVQL